MTYGRVNPMMRLVYSAFLFLFEFYAEICFWFLPGRVKK
ncbi:putative membrane protein [Shigella flexneri 1235-66]|nr:putative membrane protein [Shigella flexneri 1235-66]